MMKRWNELGRCTRIVVVWLALLAVEFGGGAVLAANVGGEKNATLAVVFAALAALDIALAIFVAKTDLLED